MSIDLKDQYFPHDYNARGDIKMQKFLIICKDRGYGIYWAIIEEMHKERKLLNDKLTMQTIADNLRTDVEQVLNIIKIGLEQKLFYEKNGYLCSKRVEKNIEKRKKISKIRSNAGKKSAKARKNKSSTND